MDQPEPAAIQPAPDLDTGDLIDPAAADPPPPPVEDPDDPSFVEPAHAAVRVNPDQLLPANPPYTTELPIEAELPYTGQPYMVDVTVPDPALPPVGTSLPAAPDSLGDHLLRDQQLPAAHADDFPGRYDDDPERDPEGHA